MSDTTDANAAIWKSAENISQWMSTAEERERQRAYHRRLLAELLPFGENEDEAFSFVDLGAGTGAAARAILDCYPGAHAILADFSPQMMAEGAKALEPYAGRYSYVEFDLAHGDWPAQIPAAVDAIISSLCVHHLPDERKRHLFAEILARLVPGGWFLNYDTVVAEDPEVQATWQRVNDRRDPDAAHKRANRTPAERERYENHVRHLMPLDAQVGFLRTAGFEAVDVYWKELDYVIYGGRRTPR